MKSNVPARRVNLGSLKPLPDPHRGRVTADPDESGPPCPQCGSDATFWFRNRRTTAPVLVCNACIDAADGVRRKGGAR